DEVEAILVAAILDGAVLLEGIRVETRCFYGRGEVDDQLGRHNRVDLGRVTALLGDGVAQAGQVDQRGLPENVVADHTCRVPGEVQVTLAIDQLLQRSGKVLRIAATDQLLGKYARGVGQFVPGADLDRLDRLAGIEVIQRSAGQALAVLAVHGVVHLFTVLERHELEVLGACVVGARADDLAVDTLLDDVSGPAGGTGDDEQRSE